MARKPGHWWKSMRRTWIRLYDPKPGDIETVYALVKEINERNKQETVAK